LSIPLEGRLRWRKTAPFHVQLELEKGSGRLTVPGNFTVRGGVVRVFRSDGRIAPGDHVAFGLWVCRAGQEPTGPAYVYEDDLMRASHVEAYLYGTPPDCELAAYEFTLLEVPSDEPKMSIGDLEELLSRFDGLKTINTADAKCHAGKWWEFWKA